MAFVAPSSSLRLPSRIRSASSSSVGLLTAKTPLIRTVLPLAGKLQSRLLQAIPTSPGKSLDLSCQAWLYMILVSVTLAVAAIPEGIPLCVTISLCLG